MAMDDLPKDYTVISLEPSAQHMRAIIEKRLDYVERESGFEPGSLIEVTDSAYLAIANVTKATPGLALAVMEMVMPSSEQLAQKQPYVITVDHIKKLRLTYESLCTFWDSPFRNAVVINVPPWYEQG